MSNFSYLKELVIPKVRALIDGLIFNTEKYGRAKTILRVEFEKLSEAANANIQCILSSQAITQASVQKIHDSYEKLVTYPQALDTMEKLKEINGTLDWRLTSYQQFV